MIAKIKALIKSNEGLYNFIMKLRWFFSYRNWSYYFYKLTGKDFLDHYETQIDKRSQRRRDSDYFEKDTADVEKLKQKFQLEYISKHMDLKKEFKVLELGCGPAKAGVFFIDFLDTDCYIGCDVSKDTLEDGWSLINSLGLNEKNPKLIHLPGGSLEPLKGMKFDLIYSVAALSHNPPEVSAKILAGLKEYMKEDCVLFVTFGCAEGETYYKDASYTTSKHKDGKWEYFVQARTAFYLYEGHIMDMCESLGLNCEIMNDWDYPYTYNGEDVSNLVHQVDTMCKITLK